LVSLGFVEAKSDTSLFIYRCGIDTAYLLLYIDDIVLTASSPELLQHTTLALQQQFFLHQRQYARDILERTGMNDCKPCSTPVDTQAKVSSDLGAPSATQLPTAA
jgi:hypothetical protein